MLAKPKKISHKKQIKEDKLVTSYYKAVGYYENNQKMILIALGVIAAIIVAAVLYSNKSAGDNMEAAEYMGKVLPIYDAGSYEEALNGREGTDIKGLTFIVDEYGGTPQGENAKIYAGNAYYYLGQYENALEYYGKYSGDNPLFRAASVAGEAAGNEALGNHEEAAELYEKAAGVTETNPMNADYLLSAGVNYVNNGDKDDAKEVLNRLKKEYQNAPASREADRYLAMAEY